jgi:hypothetical protein
VQAVNKGSYPEALTAAIAAYRAKTHPQVLQVQEAHDLAHVIADGDFAQVELFPTSL